MKVFKLLVFGLLIIVLLLGFIFSFDRETLPYGEMVVIFVALMMAFASIKSKKE